ncbi:MAG TPA: hypothetical protein VF796_30900 [Humisphaera sp.]
MPYRHRPAVVATAVLTFLGLLAPRAAAADAPPSMLFGTLLTHEARAKEEAAAGVAVVHLELAWDRYEPADGQFSDRYAAQAKAKLNAYRAAGMKVVLGTGLQHPPRWATELPGGRFVNQDGVAGPPRAANLTFNPALRARAERYLARVAADLGTDFWAVRVGSGPYVECFYPAHDAERTANSYWCYDAEAQRGCPFPGWRPGERSYKGKPFAPADVRRWYDWYLGAMVDGIDWQVAAYRRLGYRGDVHVLMPGVGSRPGDLRRCLDRYLDADADKLHTTSRAAAWHEVIARLKDKAGVVVYVSSVADGSGGNDLPQPADRAVKVDDPAVNKWSATRWLTYLADRHGLAKAGENPGRGDANGYGPGMLTAAVAQARAGRFKAFLWAHDHNLYDGTGPTLAQYAEAIAAAGK